MWVGTAPSTEGFETIPELIVGRIFSVMSKPGQACP
jgi:hypothetical protein